MTDDDLFTADDVEEMLAEVRERTYAKAVAESAARVAALEAGLKVAALGGLDAAVVFKALLKADWDEDKHPRDHGRFASKEGGGMAGAGARKLHKVDVPDPEGQDAYEVRVVENPTAAEIRSKLANLRPRQSIRGLFGADGTVHIWWEDDVHHAPTARALGLGGNIRFEDRLFIRNEDGRAVVSTHAPNPDVAAWARANGLEYEGDPATPAAGSEPLTVSGVELTPSEQQEIATDPEAIAGWRRDLAGEPDELAKFEAMVARYAKAIPGDTPRVQKGAERRTRKAAPAAGPHGNAAALLLAAIDECQHAIAEGEDPTPVLDALAELADDPEAFKGEVEGAVLKGYDESAHPRGKDGRFISKRDIAAAQTDPAKAEELKARVRPEDAGKLDAALGDKSGSFIPAKEQSKRLTAEKREGKRANRRTAMDLVNRLRDAHASGRAVSADDLHALVPHLGTLTHDELSNVRTQLFRMGASFGGTRRLQERANRLAEWARGRALEARMAEQGFSAEEMAGAKEAVGLGGASKESSSGADVDNNTEAAGPQVSDATPQESPVSGELPSQQPEQVEPPEAKEPEEDRSTISTMFGPHNAEVPTATPTAPGVSLDDIPYQVAYDAHRNSSFVPERRAKQRQNEYVEQMNADWEHLSKMAKTPEQLEQLKAEFERYKNGYRDRKLAALHAASRTASAMITGPAKFPTERNRKRLETEHNRIKELIDFRTQAMRAIQKKISPELGAIQSNNPQAVELLQKELAQHAANHELYKKINDAHKKFLKDPASLDKSDLSDAHKELVRNYKPEYSWEPHPIPPYRLTNNSANMRRIQGRIEELSKLRATPRSEHEYTGGVKVVEDPDAARIRIHFPGKPDAATIAKLKSGGFRWSPSEGAWQRHLNNAGRYAVESALKQLGHERTASTQSSPEANSPDEVPPMLTTPQPEPDIIAPDLAPGSATPEAPEPAPKPAKAPPATADAAMDLYTRAGSLTPDEFANVDATVAKLSGAELKRAAEGVRLAGRNVTRAQVAEAIKNRYRAAQRYNTFANPTPTPDLAPGPATPGAETPPAPAAAGANAANENAGGAARSQPAGIEPAPGTDASPTALTSATPGAGTVSAEPEGNQEQPLNQSLDFSTKQLRFAGRVRDVRFNADGSTRIEDEGDTRTVTYTRDGVKSGYVAKRGPDGVHRQVQAFNVREQVKPPEPEPAPAPPEPDARAEFAAAHEKRVRARTKKLLKEFDSSGEPITHREARRRAEQQVLSEYAAKQSPPA